MRTHVNAPRQADENGEFEATGSAEVTLPGEEERTRCNLIMFLPPKAAAKPSGAEPIALK